MTPISALSGRDKTQRDGPVPILVKIIPWNLLLILLLITIQGVYAQAPYVPGVQDSVKSVSAQVTDPGLYETSLFTGAATYSYSVRVPPGTNGIAPTIALQYNSHNALDRKSRTGAGWQLDVNYIKRIVNHTVDNLNDDTFELVMEGQQQDLVYNVSEGRYHTKEESYIKIERKSTTANDKGEYWEATSKDGTTYSFGLSTDSETVNPATNYAVYWYLTKITDPHGNEIYYSYTENPSANDISATYLDKIEYNNEKSRKIEFIRQNTNVPNPVFQYDEGMKVRYAMLYQEIRVSAAGGTRVSSYKFTYGLNDASTLPLLKSIQQYGSDGTTTLPATAFTYNTTKPGWMDQGNGHGGEFGGAWGIVNTDLNNDGFIDYVMSYISSNGEAYKSTFFNDGQHYALNLTLIPKEYLVYHNDVTELYTDKYQLFDVNADGYPDFVWSTGAYLNNGNIWSNSSATQWQAPVPLDGQLGVLIFDFNADGYPDILQAKTTLPKAWINTGSGWRDESSTWGIAKQISYVGDLNGDSLPDLVASDGNVYINSGKGWEYSTNWQTLKSITPSYGIKLADVNQDGLPDIVQGYYDDNVSPGVQYLGAWINTGTDWVRDNRWQPPVVNPTWHPPTYVRFITRISDTVFYEDAIILDQNGDGVPDILRDTRTHAANSPFDANRLKTIRTPAGEVISIEYAPSTSFSNVKMGVVMLVVKNITRDNGMSSGRIISTSSFDYEGGVYNYSEQEFRGFSRVTVRDATGRKNIHDFYQDDILKGREMKNALTDAAGNLLKYSLNTWHVTTNNGIHKIFLEKVQNFLLEGALSKETGVEYQYDTYGNVIRIFDKGDISTTGDEKTTDNQYSYDVNTWIMDRISKKTLFGPDGITKANEVTYQYNSKGDLIREEHWSDSGVNSVIQYTPDQYGNILSSVNPRNGISSFGYDATHTFRTQETNPMGYLASYQSDPGTGNLLQSTDPNGYTTVNRYDVFGRIQKIITQGDSDSYPTIVYQYFDTTVPHSVSIANREEVGLSGTLNMRIFYDGFGQQIMTRQEAELSSQEIVTGSNYDIVGRKTGDIVPYYAAYSSGYAPVPAGAKLTEYIYDSLDRTTAIINPDGTRQLISYNVWLTTSTDENGNIIRKENDAYGRIVAVEEMNNGDTYRTTYEYNPLDKVTKITDHAGNTFRYNYNSLGQKTTQDDPDSGHWEYTYDAAGNLVTQTDARGRTTTYTYDSLNRKTLTDFPSDTDIANIYDETVKGTLSRVIQGTSTISYSYDQRLRKTHETKVMDGNSWTTQFLYDDLDRIKSITYPTGEVIQYSYNSRGLLSTVPGILTSINYNELGKITKKNYANSISASLEYYPADYRLRRIQISGKQDLTYTYDSVGNVKSINDQVRGLSQSFMYDNLNRLTHANQSGGYGLIQYDYSPIGNLLQKNVNGFETTNTYGEGSAGPHALTKQSSSIKILPGYTNPPTDPDNDGIYEDLNGNGRLDFADVVLYFIQMEWIAANEPVSAFDLNGNGRIDFADIVRLFGEI